MRATTVETLAEFPSSLFDTDGIAWVARALGRLRSSDGLWEGYLEFERLDEAAVLRTPRETTQPKLTDLLYWASGLTAVYLEGAFRRATVVPVAEHILTASNTPAMANTPLSNTPAMAGDPVASAAWAASVASSASAAPSASALASTPSVAPPSVPVDDVPPPSTS